SFTFTSKIIKLESSNFLPCEPFSRNRSSLRQRKLKSKVTRRSGLSNPWKACRSYVISFPVLRNTNEEIGECHGKKKDWMSDEFLISVLYCFLNSDKLLLNGLTLYI